MNTSSGKNTEEDHIAGLNLILQKSAGNFENLDYDEICELRRLCSREISHRLRCAYSEVYPGMNPLVAIVRDETHRLRTTQREAARKLGVSHVHYNKVVTGREKIGLDMARRIHRVLGIDGNFILENL